MPIATSVTARGARLVRALAGLLSAAALASLTVAPGTVAPALAAGHGRTLSYHGYRIAIPPGWPVYDLTANPTLCVRFDRHAVYLGRPGAEQRCPAHAVGRTEAILVEPLAAHAAGFGGDGAPLPQGTAAGSGTSMSEFVTRGARVTATWSLHPAIVRRALGDRPLGALAAAAPPGPTHTSGIRSAGAGVGPSGSATSPSGIYTGPGFDSCSAPSPPQMSAWSASRYHAAGIYLGGANMACAQTNLTATWVSDELAAGWHLIPTYVGLQAPSNSCGCAAIRPAQSSAEGTAAATDAIAQAQRLGIGPGSPIYFDMEAYAQGGSNTAAVLRFLSSWTAGLHAAGYRSGVYSSADSGIRDLVAATGTGFQEPDEAWTADWNGVQTTSAPYLPSGDWPSHQRLHQYSGGHDETHGGVTINIDGDALDAATAGAAAAPAAAPSLKVSPVGDGTIDLQAQWIGVSVAAWRLLGGSSPTTLSSLGGAPTPGSRATVVAHSAFPYFAAQALGPAGQVLATSVPVATPARIAIYGRRAFVAPGGLGALPAGCSIGSACHIVTTILAGRTVIAGTGPELVPAGGGLVYFRLSPAARRLLAHARGHRLSVHVTAHESSGTNAASTLNLIPYRTTGTAPRTALTQAPGLSIVGATDFVSFGGAGSILAGCPQAAPCHVVTTITVRHTIIARTGSEFLGVNELGSLLFFLTPQGRAMLARAHGNQLPVRVTITAGSATASGQIRLVGFS